MKIFTFTIISALFHFSAYADRNQSATNKTGQTVCFKENKGQISDQYYRPRPDVLFSGTAGELTFHFKAKGISYQLNRVDAWVQNKNRFATHPIKRQSADSVPQQISTYRIDVNWLNSDPQTELIKSGEMADYENYYSEACPNGALGVKSYKKIVYKNIYKGIDLEWFEKNGHLKYNYQLAAYTDYKQIKIECKGAEMIYINASGELIIKTPFGNISEQKPVVQQNNKPLPASWHVENNIISFLIENVDNSLPLTIDPLVRVFGTLYGGSSLDDGMIITDNSANVFLFGETQSNSNIATSGGYQSTFGGTGIWGDAFLVKFDALGTRQWATYFGGSQSEFANYCAVDNNGDIYMVGGTSTTNSAVMATPGAHQSTPPGPMTTSFGTNDAFIAKFNSSGARVWSTYYGGSNRDWAYHVDVDLTSGDIVLTGGTSSTNGSSIATSGCHQIAHAGGVNDGFIARFNSQGLRLWGSYYGGSSNISQDDLVWCKFDSNGDICVCGNTSSSNNISTLGAYQPVIGGSNDCFLAKFNAGGILQWASYYGGSGSETFCQGLVDGTDIYLVGSTTSTNSSIMASSGAHQLNYGGGTQDTYLAKFNSSGNRLWSTYYGGTGSDDIGFPCKDQSGNIYITGGSSIQSNTSTAIATPCAYQSNYGGGTSDGFFAKFTNSGTRILGSFYGGAGADNILSCTVDIFGSLYLCGTAPITSTAALVTTGAYQTSYGGGGNDCFIAKLRGCQAILPTNTTPLNNLRMCSGVTTTLNTDCGTWYADSLGTLALTSGSIFVTGVLTHDTTFFIEDYSCGYSIGRTPVNLTVTPLPNVTIQSNNTSLCVGEPADLTALGASTYTWQGLNIGISNTINPIHILLGLPTTYTVTATDQYGCTNVTDLTVIPTQCVGIKEEDYENTFVVSPNPNQGDLRIYSSSEIKLELHDQLGKKMKTIEIKAGIETQLMLNDLPAGIYFLKDLKNQQNKKIVVTH